MLLFRLTFLAAIAAPFSAAAGAQVILPAAQDNTIYAEAPGNSNGAGDHFIAGKSGIAAGVRRGLIAFDLSGLPAAIRVDRVALELTFQGATNQESQSRVVALHRLLADWGEGASDAGPGGSSGSGNGTAAAAADATWQHRFFNTQNWAAYDPGVAGSGGGDFASGASATATVGIVPDVLVTWETVRSEPPSGMVADVEQWLADPASNAGWLLKMVDESPVRTARRFYSKDASAAGVAPRLAIDYTVVPEPAALAMLAAVALGATAAMRGLRRGV